LNIWFSWVLNVDEESAVFTSFILARQSWSPSIHCTETWLLGTGGPSGGQQVTLAQCPFHFVYRWFWNMGISHCHVWLPVDSDIRMIQQDELGCPWWSRFLLCLFWLLTLCVPARTATPLGTTQHVVKGAVWRCSWTAASWVVLKGGTSLRRGRTGMRYRNLATACPACHGSWLQIHTMGKQPRQSSPCGLGSAPSWTKWSRTHQRWHCGRIWPYATRSTGLSDLVVPAIPMDYHQFQMDSWSITIIFLYIYKIYIFIYIYISYIPLFYGNHWGVFLGSPAFCRNSWGPRNSSELNDLPSCVSSDKSWGWTSLDPRMAISQLL
jgi:hypothetical protein